jgi:hypothetical protein
MPRNRRSGSSARPSLPAPRIPAADAPRDRNDTLGRDPLPTGRSWLEEGADALRDDPTLGLDERAGWLASDVMESDRIARQNAEKRQALLEEAGEQPESMDRFAREPQADRFSAWPSPGGTPAPEEDPFAAAAPAVSGMNGWMDAETAPAGGRARDLQPEAGVPGVAAEATATIFREPEGPITPAGDYETPRPLREPATEPLRPGAPLRPNR